MLHRPPAPLVSLSCHRLTCASQVKRAIETGNLEGARLYAQNAIRKKSEALNYLKVRRALESRAYSSTVGGASSDRAAKPQRAAQSAAQSPRAQP